MAGAGLSPRVACAKPSVGVGDNHVMCFSHVDGHEPMLEMMEVAEGLKGFGSTSSTGSHFDDHGQILPTWQS